ncbi:MAG: hypothetical protein OXC62_07750 [Aestuariivita sp.]|nr:hypothetical protein [Aestuariivita sp.]
MGVVSAVVWTRFIRWDKKLPRRHNRRSAQRAFAVAARTLEVDLKRLLEKAVRIACVASRVFLHSQEYDVIFFLQGYF